MFLSYKEFTTQLSEKLITVGGKAYPKFGTVVAMMGAGASGKGTIIKYLLGVEGKVLDVDALKEMAQAAPKLKALIKESFDVDISKDAFSLKDPENVRLLHEILANKLKIVDKHKQAFYTSVLAADPSCKPNIIFDVTMKDSARLKEISDTVEMLGYAPLNVHMIWVIQDVEIAFEQNKTRSRTVPEDILKHAHAGTSQTVFDMLHDKDVIGSKIDGDIVFAFNHPKFDTKIRKGAKRGAGFVEEATYVYVKRAGKSPMKAADIGKDLLQKIAAYVPEGSPWEELI